MSVGKTSKTTVSLAVVLDNPSKVFFAGEMISGRVKFHIEPHHKVKILSINLNAEYYYMKGLKEAVEVIYTETCPADLRSAGDGNSEMPFSMVVRPDSPTSLATSLGGIRYRIDSTMLYKDGDRISNTEAAELFTVNAQRQLPDDSSGLKTSAVEGWSMLSKCCGAVSADLELVCASLLCGNSATINACIANDTSHHIRGTAVSLVQSVLRLRDRKVAKTTVAVKERGGVLPGKRQVWLSERFLIPPLPPSSNDGYFKVSYKMVLTVQKSSTKGICLKIPLLIGNLPRERDSLPLSSMDESLAEGRCSTLSSDMTTGFKPLYVTYIS